MTTTAPLSRDTYGTVHRASIANLVAEYGVDTAAAMVEAALSAVHADFYYDERVELRAFVATLSDSPIDLAPLALSALELEAATLIESTLATHGRGTLACAWCGRDHYIDGDATLADTLAVAALIEHTRYAHNGPASVLFTGPVVVLKGVRA